MNPHLGSLLPVLLFFPLVAHGTIVTTTTDEDDGSLGGGTGISLREAVKYSATGDTITFAPALSGQTIRFTEGEILIDRSITINGSSLPVKVTLSGDKTGDGSDYQDTRVFIITGDIVDLDSLVISGGNSNGTLDSSLFGRGGAITVYNTATKLTIKNSTVTANHAVARGGGVYFESWNSAALLKIQNSTFSGNTSNSEGGAIYVKGALLVQNSILSGNSAELGGAVSCDDCSPVFEDTTFSTNSASDGGAIRYSSINPNSHFTLTLDRSIFCENSVSGEGGAIYSNGELVIRSSKFCENSAMEGGAIYSRKTAADVQDTVLSGNIAEFRGGAIWKSDSQITIRNSVVSANTASDGAGLYTASVQVVLLNSTFSENVAGREGGGLRHTMGSLSVENSTFSGNVAEISGGAIYGRSGMYSFLNCTVSANISIQWTGGGLEFEGDDFVLNNSIVAGNFAPAFPIAANISGTPAGSNNVTSGTPRLAPLGDYGGPTHTMPPLPGSPAIDAGGSSSPTTDQRGFSRVGNPDIGAVEYQGNTDLARVWTVDPDGDGSPFGVEQALGTDNFSADPANSGNLTPPVFAASGELSLGFGINSAAVAGTRWILTRSPDLSPGSFVEVYRYDGVADTAAAGIAYIRSASGVSVTDENPPVDGAFYRFEAGYEP